MYRQLAVLALIVLAGCSGQTASSQAPAVTASPAPLATDLATPKPTASPRGGAPAELQGKWRTVISEHDQPVLTIKEFNYTIERLGIGTGAIDVHDDVIDFYGSNLCPGTGTYRWSIDGDTLTLKATATDPCPNRADAILNRPFTRMG